MNIEIKLRDVSKYLINFIDFVIANAKIEKKKNKIVRKKFMKNKEIFVFDIKNYISLIKYIINSKRIPDDHPLFDDIFQNCCLEVFKLSKRFDPKFGIDFTTYMHHRVVGCIKDFFREITQLSRGDIKKIRNLQEIPEKLMKPLSIDDADFKTSLIPTIEFENKLIEDLSFDEMMKKLINLSKQFRRSDIIEDYLNTQNMGITAKNFGLCNSRISQIISEFRNIVRDNLDYILN